MNKIFKWSLLLVVPIFLATAVAPEAWGFFGHRRINRMAVFTLPQEIFGFYKNNIEFITEHAVDPDKRRYATKHEAVRHYIDLDHHGTYPFENVPRQWTDVLVKYTDVFIVNEKEDTILVFGKDVMEYKDGDLLLKKHNNAIVTEETYKGFYKSEILPLYYEDDWLIDCEELTKMLQYAGVNINCTSAFGIDQFSGYGIVPYHLESMQRRLTKAFEAKDASRILQLSAEMGHYIGDAHVPLHTTENYNGQMTGQNGIHGFWESRIPELFADEEYDYFVGQAEYISNPNEYFWDIVLTSHQYVDSLLAIEKQLSLTFPQDQQYCFENRNDRTIRMQCAAYTRAYSDLLDGQVEDRMQASILAVGSSWYTAWVDAGQPSIQSIINEGVSEAAKEELKKLEEQFKKGEAKGRAHGQ